MFSYQLRVLFRIRGWTGAVVFLLGLAVGVPTVCSCLKGLPLVLLGLGLRYWAAGYIGPDSRASGFVCYKRVVSGPYRYFRHPLYLGNLLLVIGMLFALTPPFWYKLAVLVGFILAYGAFALTEQRLLSDIPGSQPGFDRTAALTEWSTWISAGLGWLLTLGKALLRSNR